ncbi:MAG: transcriptional regulator [Gammaproteobacteria bacterium]|nr:transcriptional regulator [Gammaproteobacteria bacterium]MDJ0892529.1 transcriptional regulator [Gammaproteobacteria bacterium]
MKLEFATDKLGWLDCYTAKPYTHSVVFVEAPVFSRLVSDYLSDDEYAALQWALALRPDAGVLIPGSGGVRKLRWAGSGRGKRGGLRVIYYWRNKAGEIWLLTIYAKKEAADIPLGVLRKLRQEIES